MKNFVVFLSCLALATNAIAAAPATNAPSAAPAPKAPQGNAPAPTAAPTAPATPALAFCGLKLDDYIGDLATTLKLSDTEKKQVESLYLEDGISLQAILNNDSLSPLQQAQQVSVLRDARNTKIDTLLDKVDRQQAFAKIEARYRVALTMLAADGGLVPAPAPAPAAP